MKSSDTNDWGSHLQPSDEQILIRTAQNITPLVQNQKKMRRFRARLTEFAEKWKAHRTAHEAEQEGKWQPSMGIPENPLGVIWPYAYIQQQLGHFPKYPNVPTILGDYALLGVIHDQVLPQCERINDGCLPAQLAEKIWHNLLTDIGSESRSVGPTRLGAEPEPRYVIHENQLAQSLERVKADLEARRLLKPNCREAQPSATAPKPSQRPAGGTTQVEAMGNASEKDMAESMIKNKEAQGKYDVFLCHNSKDKAAVEEIAKRLKDVGIRPWLDKWDLIPGETVMEAVEKAITDIKCGALFFGPADIGGWHVMEIRAYVESKAGQKARFIPVILPGVKDEPELPVFVRQSLWVDMRKWNEKGSDAFDRLVCGIIERLPGELPVGGLTARDVFEWQNRCR